MKRFMLLILLVVAALTIAADVASAQVTIADAFTAVEDGVETAMGYALAAVIAILGSVLVLMAGRALLRRFARV